MPTLPPNQYLLYADDGYDSHVAGLMLAEKGVAYRVQMLYDRPEFLAQLNPYHTLPVLASRDVVLYEIGVMAEYLEDRHRAFPLLPATPDERAKVRQLAWRLQQDWLRLGRILLTHPDSFDKKTAETAKKSLTDSLITLSPLFARSEYFMSDTFGLCDVLLAPLLWRLNDMGISLPAQLAKPIMDYGQRLFSRPSFIQSLNPPLQESDDD